MLEEHLFRVRPRVQSTYNPFPSPGVLHLLHFFSSSLSVPVPSCSQTRSGITLCPSSHLITHRFVSSLQIYRAFSQTSITKMPPIERPISGEKYDVVFIGGGSGGSAGSVCITRVYLCSATQCDLRSVALRFMVRRRPS